jgi:hypothetical protein
VEGVVSWIVCRNTVTLAEGKHFATFYENRGGSGLIEPAGSLGCTETLLDEADELKILGPEE